MRTLISVFLTLPFYCATAQVTGLVSIPIAEMMGVREVEIGHSVEGTEQRLEKRYFHSASIVMGLTNWLEAGADTDFLGSSNWGFKVKAFEDPKGRYAVCAGIDSINNAESAPFVVGRYDLNGYRLHAGWQRDDRSRFICGVDFPLGETVSAAIDHRTGDGGATWAAVYWMVPMCEGLTFEFDLGVPNNRTEGTQHAFGVSYGFRF